MTANVTAESHYGDRHPCHTASIRGPEDTPKILILQSLLTNQDLLVDSHAQELTHNQTPHRPTGWWGVFVLGSVAEWLIAPGLPPADLWASKPLAGSRQFEA